MLPDFPRLGGGAAEIPFPLAFLASLFVDVNELVEPELVRDLQQKMADLLFVHTSGIYTPFLDVHQPVYVVLFHCMHTACILHIPADANPPSMPRTLTSI